MTTGKWLKPNQHLKDAGLHLTQFDLVKFDREKQIQARHNLKASFELGQL